MSKLLKVPAGNFHAAITVTNGATLQLFRNNSTSYPRFVFHLNRDGSVQNKLQDESNGHVLQSEHFGNVSNFQPHQTTKLHLDVCKSILVVYDDYHHVVGQIQDSDLNLMKMLGFTYTSEQNVSIKIDQGSSSCGSYGGSDTVSSYGTPAKNGNWTGFLGAMLGQGNGEPIPWWIWLLVAIAGLMVILIIIFGCLAGAASTAIKRTQTVTRTL